jgi:hypothetical protein
LIIAFHRQTMAHIIFALAAAGAVLPNSLLSQTLAALLAILILGYLLRSRPAVSILLGVLVFALAWLAFLKAPLPADQRAIVLAGSNSRVSLMGSFTVLWIAAGLSLAALGSLVNASLQRRVILSAHVLLLSAAVVCVINIQSCPIQDEPEGESDSNTR